MRLCLSANGMVFTGLDSDQDERGAKAQGTHHMKNDTESTGRTRMRRPSLSARAPEGCGFKQVGLYEEDFSGRVGRDGV